MTTMKNARPYHHGDLRAQLLETVRALVEETGPDGFSISEASRRAGVSSAAPYKHFRDRAEIMQGVAAAGLTRLGDRMAEAIGETEQGSLERIEAIGRTYIAFAHDEPGVFKVMFGMTHEGEDEATLAAGERTYGILIDAVAGRMGASCEAEDVQDRAYMLWSLVHGHSFLVVEGATPAGRSRPSEERFLRTAAEQIVDGRRLEEGEAPR